MARSARSSRTKTNRASLRAKFHQPHETARAERLNAKLMELVKQPTASQIEAEMIRRENADSDAMLIDDAKEQATETAVDMQIDVDETGVKPRRVRKNQGKTPSRVQKRRRGKPHAQITFPHLSGKGRKHAKTPIKRGSRSKPRT